MCVTNHGPLGALAFKAGKESMAQIQMVEGESVVVSLQI